MPSSQAPMPDSIVKGDDPMPSSFGDDPDFYNEGRIAKIKRKLLQDPLIPVGLGLTCWALLGASKSIKAGTKTRTNMFFRLRVYAQGFTLLMICAGGMYWKEDRAKRKEYNELMAEQKRQEKRDAWIRELELRDQEEQAERAQRKRRMEAAKAKAEAAAAKASAAGDPAAASTDASSGLSDEDVMDLVGSTAFIGKALSLFRRRTRRDD